MKDKFEVSEVDLNFLKRMEMNDVITVLPEKERDGSSFSYKIIRVPGGWIYYFYGTYAANTQFVREE